MNLLEGAYTDRSEIYEKVRVGLKKMKAEELSALYSMVLVRVTVRDNIH